MTESTRSSSPRWAVLLLILGSLIAFGSIGGLLMLNRPTPIPDSTSMPTAHIPGTPHPTPTAADQPLIARLIVQPPTLEAPPTSTAEPSTNSPTLTPTTRPSQTQAPEAAQPTYSGTPIAFTNEEKNALSWMCYYEIGGMGSVKYDACLSVISTVRARFTLASGFGTDVMSVLTRPNQFNIPIVTDRPHDTFLPTVEQYAAGARGSCNAFLYFDSNAGGPSLCIIYGFNSFMEFHNGWN